MKKMLVLLTENISTNICCLDIIVVSGATTSSRVLSSLLCWFQIMNQSTSGELYSKMTLRVNQWG